MAPSPDTRRSSHSRGLRYKQTRRYKRKDDPRWSPEANRKRAEYMRGKTFPLETRAAMSATRRNPGQDPSDPAWDAELWERDRQAYINQIRNRERMLAAIDADPTQVAEQLRGYMELYYHQLRSVFVGEQVDVERLKTMVEHGRLDDLLMVWSQEYP